MKRLVVLVLSVLVFCLPVWTQDPTPQSAQSSGGSSPPHLIGSGSFPVKVVRTIDSSKLKEGDLIEVETLGAFKLRDGTLVPRRSKLAGHVIASKARSKGDSESQLILTFDKLDIANGKQLSIKSVVQAVFPRAEDTPTPYMGGTESVSPVVTDVTIGSNPSSNNHPSPVMTPNSIGVHGIDDLQLDRGILSSKGKHVKLNAGVRMIVRVNILG